MTAPSAPSFAGPFTNRTPLRAWVAHGLHCALMRAPMHGAINGYVLAGPSFTYEMAQEVDVHGGVTYGPNDAGWIGFDTLHSGDVWPGTPPEWSGTSWDRHWTEDAVAEETERLAAEVKRVSEL